MWKDLETNEDLLGYKAHSMLLKSVILKDLILKKHTDEDIILIQNEINRIPREKLNVQTPTKIFFASLNTSVAVVT